jgi:myo-inositol 2-dehydrogenase/D-chiro-inositol 1-dehydrogenase
VDRVRAGFIGTGGFPNIFFFPQLSLHAVEPVAVCDIVEERAVDAQRRFGFAAAYTDFHEMLDSERLDAIFVAIGGQAHYEIARELLPRRIPLYLQKPPSSTSAQAAELTAFAAEHATLCHVGFNLRYSVAHRHAREIMESAAFGRVSLVLFRYGLMIPGTWRFAMAEQHVHAFDSLLFLGGPVTEVRAMPGLTDGARSYAALLKFESGAVGALSFTSGQSDSKEFTYFEVTGENQNFLTCHDFDLVYRRGGAGAADEVYTRGNYGHLPNLHWLGYHDDVANFLAAIRGLEDDRSPVATTVATMALCEEVYKQLREAGAPE